MGERDYNPGAGELEAAWTLKWLIRPVSGPIRTIRANEERRQAHEPPHEQSPRADGAVWEMRNCVQSQNHGAHHSKALS